MSEESLVKTALITGGTSGIGRATALAMAKVGIHVIISGRNLERGAQTVDEIKKAGGEADFVESSFVGKGSAQKLAAAALKLSKTGRVDILVNNAAEAGFMPTDQTPEETFDAVMGTNVKVPYYLVAELVPLMVQHGAGSVVNVSTMVADIGMAGASLYGASKAALSLLTKAWTAEYGAGGVRFNTVSPGPVRTPGTVGMGDSLDKLASMAAAGKPALAEDIASTIVFLASDAAQFVHGANLAVDGGRTAV